MAEVSQQVQDARGKALEEKLDRIEKGLSALDSPVFPHRDGGGVTSWEADTVKPYVASLTKNSPRFDRKSVNWRNLPKAYKYGDREVGWGDENAGAFYSDLIQYTRQKGIGSDFSDRYTRHMQPIIDSIPKAVQGMSEGIGSDGGFAVIPEFSQQIFTRTYESSVFETTDNFTVAGNNMTFPRNAETSRVDGQRAGGLLGYWMAEGNSITKSNPTINAFNLKLKKVAVVIYLTEELIADAGQSLEAYCTRKASEEFKFQIDNACFRGQGAARPQGFLYSKAMYSVAAVGGQATKTIVPQNITDMWRHLYPGSEQNAVWYINRNCLSQLFLMTLGVGTAGVVVYMPPGGLSASPYATLLGRPVIPVEYASTLGSVGDISLVDMSHYCTISKGGIVQAQSIHVEFLTDQLALRFTMRVDGETWENSTVVPYQGDATLDVQSSFVTLAAR